MQYYFQRYSWSFRQSHENPALRDLYKKFLREPLGELSHQLLHTHYTPRGI